MEDLVKDIPNEKTRKIYELFYNSEPLWQDEIYAKMRAEGIISQGWIGDAQGWFIMRTVQPTDTTDTTFKATGYYFVKSPQDKRKFSLTYAGDCGEGP